MTSTASTIHRDRSVADESDGVDTVATCPTCGTAYNLDRGQPEELADETRTPEAPVRAALPATPTADLPAGAVLRAPLAMALRVILEVVDGRRLARQLVEIVSASVGRYVGTMASCRRPLHAARLLSVRVCRPSETGAEAAAVVLLDRRVRAVAARFEQDGGQTWRCVAFRVL